MKCYTRNDKVKQQDRRRSNKVIIRLYDEACTVIDGAAKKLSSKFAALNVI